MLSMFLKLSMVFTSHKFLSINLKWPKEGDHLSLERSVKIHDSSRTAGKILIQY